MIQPYNQPTLNELKLVPMKFVNTLPSKIQFEECAISGTSVYLLAVHIVFKLLQDIIRLLNTTVLDNKVVILYSYFLQLETIQRYINTTVPFVNNSVAKKIFGWHILAIGSMKGSGTNIVLFSTAKYRILNEVGFLNECRRLNVVVTSARSLNISIVDTSTVIEKVDELSYIQLRYIYEVCSKEKTIYNS